MDKMLYCAKRATSLFDRNATCSLTDGPENMTDSSLYIFLVLLALIFAGLLLWFRQSRGFMQKVNMHATLPEGMDSSSARPSTSAAVLSQERPQTPEQEPTPATDALETEPMVDYAQPWTSAEVLSQERPQTPEQDPTPATDALETEPMVDYAQPSTSATVLSQERPQTPEQEPTPATSASVLSESNPSKSPTDAPAQNYPTEKHTKGRKGLPCLAAVQRGFQTLLSKVCPSLERPQTPGQEPTPAEPTERTFDSIYQPGKKLTSKSHGVVHEGIRKSDGKQVIIKRVKPRRFDFHIGDSQALCREAALMQIMEHSDRVMKLYDWFEDDNLLIMEHPGTSITLCDFIKDKGGRLTEAEAKDIMQKLIAALRDCSEKDVYYKDISLKKVLIDPDTMQIKLTGFYRALSIRERQTPELKSVAERRIDALMATNEGLHRALKRMVKGQCLWFGRKNTGLSEEYQDLLLKLRDRESGIILQKILDNDWFKNTPDTDALESGSYMQFEGMDSSSAQPLPRNPSNSLTDVPAQNNPTGRGRDEHQTRVSHEGATGA